MKRVWWLVLVAAFVAVTALAQLATLVLDPDHPAIQWTSTPGDDVISRLNQSMSNGRVRIESKEQKEDLKQLLKILDIPISSQMLVSSNASLQGARIRPENPRALYFNDTTVVGIVAGSALIEVAVHDPRQGVNFYTMGRNSQAPMFERQTFCIMCHETELGVPGMILHSVPTAANGTALFQLGAWDANDRTPFPNRWGGWYVTGQYAPFAHMGNRLIADWHKPGVLAPAVAGKAAVAGAWTANYPVATSDIVALLVFEHQAETLNWITRVGWHARIAASEGKPAEVTRETVEALVDSLLFVKEAPLPVKVASTSGFAAEFAARGPKDQKGRSLRDFDLKRRLFRYPLSYLIYSPGFDALAETAKVQAYDRLWKVLSGDVREPRYAHLTPELRRAIVEILRDTKPGLPAYFAAQSVR